MAFCQKRTFTQHPPWLDPDGQRCRLGLGVVRPGVRRRCIGGQTESGSLEELTENLNILLPAFWRVLFRWSASKVTWRHPDLLETLAVSFLQLGNLADSLPDFPAVVASVEDKHLEPHLLTLASTPPCPPTLEVG